MTDFEFVPYTPAMSDACKELEMTSSQGTRIEVRFHRSVFHWRAETYDQWEILVARHQDRVAGLMARAQKTVEVHGEPTVVNYLFDARIHPDYRGQRLGTQLVKHIVTQGMKEGTPLHYMYTQPDNTAVHRGTRRFNTTQVGQAKLLVWPVYRRFRTPEQFDQVTSDAVHEAYLAQRGPFDFYTPPSTNGTRTGHLLSLSNGDAGCSVWSNEGLLEEEVLTVPRHLALIGSALRRWPISKLRLPQVPTPGTRLKGWYIFDAYGPVRAMRELVREVNNRAYEAGVDFCYLCDSDAKPWFNAVKRDVPQVFTARWALAMGLWGLEADAAPPQTAYLDVRDL